MIDEGLVKFSREKLVLTNEGKKHAWKYKNITCRKCYGKGISLESYKKEFEKFKSIFRNIPRAIEKYDQGSMRPEDAFSRAMFINERGDLIESDMLIIGDDDLISIASIILGPPRRIVVMEIDERITQFIKNVTEKLDYDVEVVVYDVRKELPEKLKRKFDVFVMDPVDNLYALKIFISRGVSALKGEYCTGYFGISYLEISLKDLHEIERTLISMNMVITDIIRKFSIYPWKHNIEIYKNHFVMGKLLKKMKVKARGHDFYHSTLFRCECIGTPKLLIKENIESNQFTQFYIDDEREIVL